MSKLEKESVGMSLNTEIEERLGLGALLIGGGHKIGN